MFDWVATTRGGLEIPGLGRGQSALTGQAIRSLSVKGKGLTIPFSFPVPEGAVVRIFKRHTLHGPKLKQTRYWFGWERSDGTQRYFEFGGPSIRTHYER